MSKRKARSSNPTTTFSPKDARPKWFSGLLAIILATLAALALLDYRPEQISSISTLNVDRNLIGEWGAQFSHHTLHLFGLGAWVIPIGLFWLSYMYFGSHAFRLKISKYLYLLILFICISVFGAILQTEQLSAEFAPNYFNNGLGGWLGHLIYDSYLKNFIGMVGTLVVFGVLSAFAIIYILGDNLLADTFRTLKKQAAAWADKRAQQAELKKAAKEKSQLQKEILKKQLGKDKSALPTKSAAKDSQNQPQVPARQKVVKRSFFSRLFGKSKPKTATPAPATKTEVEPLVSLPHSSSATPPVKETTTPSLRKAAPPEPEEEIPPPPKPKLSELRPALSIRGKNAAKAEDSADPTSTSEAGTLKIIKSEETRKASIHRPERQGDYVFPDLNLLSEPVAENEKEPPEVYQRTAEMLVQTLDEFGVKVTMGEVHAGPVITRYDVYPAPGVRVEKIVNLDKNLALGLKALSVRILAPVPGKGCVGIEVPNKKPQSVYIRDILESEDWANTKAEIPIALGKEVSGKPMIADLTKMPHLLIAGSTGSGKTVCINSIITSLLYHSSPEDIRFVMVDPKIVEMQVYNTLPHMLVPVVTDPKKVPNALKYLLNEMEKRYHTFAKVGVRNIAGYNAKMARDRKDADAAEAEERAAAMDAEMTPEERAASSSVSVPRDPDITHELPGKLPYIVCIVDELADLMMVAPADIETGIARLAQLARAAGIHLILATQRPSVNVITGVIKANLPSRIAFKVASKVDSRTILDTMGADHLIGKGDMLFLPPGSADLVRSQGAFVADEEITAIVEFITQQNGEPQFDEQFQRNIEEGDDSESDSPAGDWDDELVPAAIDVIRNSKRASTSMLQRRLKIGYNRAARIMEILEDEGMVGPENGSSPREILMDLD